MSIGLAAEVIAHFLPRLVELHNYPQANAVPQKVTNWTTLNRKVLPKLKIQLSQDQIQALANGQEGFIEQFLHEVRLKIDRLQHGRSLSVSPSKDSISQEDQDKLGQAQQHRKPSNYTDMIQQRQAQQQHGSGTVKRPASKGYIPPKVRRDPSLSGTGSGDGSAIPTMKRLSLTPSKPTAMSSLAKSSPRPIPSQSLKQVMKPPQKSHHPTSPSSATVRASVPTRDSEKTVLAEKLAEKDALIIQLRSRVQELEQQVEYGNQQVLDLQRQLMGSSESVIQQQQPQQDAVELS